MAEKRGFLGNAKLVFSYIIEFFKGIYYLLAINWMTILVFEAVYKLLAYFLFRPIISGIMLLAYKASGFSFIANMNIGKILTNPVSWICVLIILFIVSVYMLFDICCIVICFHASYHRQKIPLLYMMKRGIIAAKDILLPKNYRMILFLLLIIPMSQLVSLPGFVEGFAIPNFVMSFIQSRTWLFVIFIIASVYVEIVCIQWIFSFHNFTLKRERFVDASRGSWRMIKGKKKFPVYIASVVGWQLLVYLAFLGIMALGGLVIILISHIPFTSVVVDSSFAVLVDVLYAFMFCMATPLCFLGISQIYYMGKKHEGGDIPGRFDMKGAIHLVDTRLVRKLYRKRWLIIFLGLATVLVVNIVMALYRQSDYYVQYVASDIKINAHRGDEVNFPENTMPAFESAIEKGADMIELDVHLTSDGEVVVMHDESLKRTTGLKKYIYEMTAADIAELDAGSWFSQEFAGTKVPMLSDVMELALNNDILLNIELKPSEETDGLVEKVIDMIHEYGIEDRCLLASLTYSELEDAKAYDESIPTLYITHILLGDMTEMDAADGYSVESSSISASFIRNMHKKGKFVYVWTVNTESNLKEVISMQPDGIVTNDIEIAKTLLEDKKDDGYWETYINTLDSMF